MNIDSKLKRFVVLLDKAPFVLFLESENYLPHADHLIPALNRFNLSFTNVFTTAPIGPNQDIRKIISATNTLDNPLAYNIINALANNSALTDNFNNTTYFPVHFFTKNDWQNHIDWQNVDINLEPATYEFTITVNRITHELDLIHSNDLVNSAEAYDGIMNLSSIDISAPFPKLLLKEYAADVYEIIKVMSMNREPATIAKSRYLSVMHTGHDIFNWVNLKKIEKDLTAVIKAGGITIEE